MLAGAEEADNSEGRPHLEAIVGLEPSHLWRTAPAENLRRLETRGMSGATVFAPTSRSIIHGEVVSAGDVTGGP